MPLRIRSARTERRVIGPDAAVMDVEMPEAVPRGPVRSDIAKLRHAIYNGP